MGVKWWEFLNEWEVYTVVPGFDISVLVWRLAALAG